MRPLSSIIVNTLSSYHFPDSFDDPDFIEFLEKDETQLILLSILLESSSAFYLYKTTGVRSPSIPYTFFLRPGIKPSKGSNGLDS